MLKFIFNWKADIPMPIDKWAKADILCALTNITSLIVITMIDEDALTNLAKKRIFD